VFLWCKGTKLIDTSTGSVTNFDGLSNKMEDGESGQTH